MSPGVDSCGHEILYADRMVHCWRIFFSLLADFVPLPKVPLFGFTL